MENLTVCGNVYIDSNGATHVWIDKLVQPFFFLHYAVKVYHLFKLIELDTQINNSFSSVSLIFLDAFTI